MESIIQSIQTGPEEHFLSIRKTLEGYLSSDIVKELIQNADDARATNIDFIIFHGNNCSKKHILIDRPALAILNNGPYTNENHKAIPKIIGGTKDSDSTQVGRFGLGLKSVYNICELFYYWGYAKDEENIKRGLLNPWGWETLKDEDPYRSYLNSGIVEEGLKRLENTFSNLREDGFALWLPLSNGSQELFFKRPKTTIEELRREVFDNTPFQLYLAQCASIKSIRLYEADNLDTERKITFEYKKESENSLWRPNEHHSLESEDYNGTIRFTQENITKEWLYQGIQHYVTDTQKLEEFYEDKDWKKNYDIKIKKNIPVKAQQHAAITLIGEANLEDNAKKRPHFIWASFMPIDEKENYSVNSLNIVLHGYFLLTSDRKKLAGIHDSESSIESKWNKYICNEILMPKFPNLLFTLKEKDSTQIVKAIHENIEFFENFQNAITSRSIYAKVLNSKGVSWQCIPREEFDRKEKYQLSLPKHLEAQFVDKLKESKEDTLYILSSMNESLLPSDCIFEEIPSDTIEIILNLFLETVHEPTDLSAGILEWLDIFWGKTKESHAPWGEFIIQLIGKGFFSKVSNVSGFTEIIKKNYSEQKLRICSHDNFHDAIKNLAKERKFTPDFIYLPIGESENYVIVFEKKNLIEALLNYLVNKPSKTLSDNKLLNLFRQDLEKIGAKPNEQFYEKNCVLVANNLMSYKEVGALIKEHRLFKKPNESQREKWINTHLAESLNKEVYVFAKEEYGTLESIPEITVHSIVESILFNDINKNSDKKKLIEILFGEGKEVSFDTKNAIRKLICAKEMEGIELIVFPNDENYSFLKELDERFAAKTEFLESNSCKDLTQRQIEVLEIKDIERNSENFLIKIIEVLLDDDSSWENAVHISTCLKKLQSIENLEGKLLNTSWIPFNKKGISPGKIFIESSYSKALTQLDFVQKMEWVTLPKVEVSKYIPSEHLDKLFDKKAQLRRFKSDCKEFFNKGVSENHALFPDSFPINEESEGVLSTFVDNSSFAWESMKFLQIAKVYGLELVDFANILPKNATQATRKDILNDFSKVEKLKQKDIRVFYEAYLTSCAKENINLFTENPNLLLPTRSNKKDEQWSTGCEILLTMRDDGNTFQLLDEDLWRKWEHNEIIINLEKLYLSRDSENSEKLESEYKPYESLETYFANYRGENARISLFLSLLRYDKDSDKLAKKLCPTKNWRDELRLVCKPHEYNPSVAIAIDYYALSDEIKELNFAGTSSVIIKDKKKSKSLFSKSPKFITPIGFEFWKLSFDTTADGCAPFVPNEIFVDSLYNTITEWLDCNKRKFPEQEEAIKMIEGKLNDLWNESSPTQISVESTCNVLRARMPQILDVLKLKKNSELGKLRCEYDEELQSKGSVNQEKLEKIWNNAKNDEEVGNALRNKISENGYNTSSVLFELLQNADDAILQANELYKLRQQVHSDKIEYVKIQYNNSGHQLWFLHNGRPINDGGDYNKEWESDLRNMVNFNVSYKNTQQDSASTTGMFGLGFKSVHLISEEPEIYSGNLHFKIVNTLFPHSEAGIENKDSSFSTQFLLPLKHTIEAKDIFSKLNNVHKIIPVTCRGINKLEVESDSDNINTYSVEYKPTTLLSCADEKSCWKICYNCNVLIFETIVNCRGKEQLFSLVFNIKAHGEEIEKIINFKDTSFLWNTMPTQEEWECKYVFNGFFKLNPGRTHVDIQDKDTLNYVSSVGENLGYGLCELYEKKWSDLSEQAWADLWNILSVGIINEKIDEKTDRQKFLRTLHCNGKGLSYWTQRKKLAASGLEKPFSPLTKLDNEVFIDDYFIGDGIKKVIKDNNVYTSNFINSNKTFVLRKLGYEEKNTQSNKEIDFYDRILSLICENNQLSAKQFHSLLPALDEWTESKKELLVKTQEGNYKPIQQILIPRIELTSNEREEEFLRADIAPDKYLLDIEYVTKKEDVQLYKKIRGSFETNAELLCHWIVNADYEKREVVLKYLNTLAPNSAVKNLLKQEKDRNNSAWLFNFQEMLELTKGKYQEILQFLFPEYWRIESPYVDPPSDSLTSSKVISSFSDIKNIEKKTGNNPFPELCWPDRFTNGELLNNLERNDLETWCTLLLLGCLQSMGRQTPYQHRGFIESVKQTEEAILWKCFTSKNGYTNSAQWITSIDLWFDKQTNVQTYSEWMHYFIYMYQINKYITRYINLFNNLPMQITDDNFDFNEYFAPRVASKMTGGGKRWDIPPIPLKIGRYWVIRELSRLNFKDYRNPKILQYCWIPKSTVLDRFNVASSDSNDNNHSLLVERLKEINNGIIPHFNYNFDLALNLQED